MSLAAQLAPWHGIFNAAVGILIFRQAWLGWKIRRARRTGAAFPIASVKAHRKIGPFLPLLAAFGFAAGLGLIALDHLPLLAFPAHFFLGLSIVLLLLLQRWMGSRIKGPLSSIRAPHFFIGLMILAAYVGQVLLGLNMLL